MSWNYNVPPRKAANIRKAINEIAPIPEDIPVRYASIGRDFFPTMHARENGVAASDSGCVEALTLRDIGTPALVRRREAAVLEKTKRGQPIIKVYAKNCQQTDKFDLTGIVDEMYRFALYRWPRSWRPEYRQRLARRRAEEIKNGAKVKHRQSPRSVQQTAVRLTSFT